MIYNYLFRVYVVFGITSNLEMTKLLGGCVQVTGKHYAVLPFYLNLQIEPSQIFVPIGVLEVPLQCAMMLKKALKKKKLRSSVSTDKAS